MKKTSDSKAMKDVWAWKEAIAKDVEHLPLRSAIREILNRAEKAERAVRRPGVGSRKKVRRTA